MTVKKISRQEAIDKGYFGPVYHGTNETARAAIKNQGFKLHIGSERSGNVSHGYQATNYADGKPAPIHHLGFGIYFTTVKAIAKSFNNGTLRGLKTYYLNIPRKEVINFGSQSNMMKWWIKNGYDIPQIYPNSELDPKQVNAARLEATKKLTDHLKSKYDAVWFKGKGLKKLLDGDQICVFDPNRIFELDNTLASGFEIGAKVKRKSDGMLGEIKGIHLDEKKIAELRESSGDAVNWIKPDTKRVMSVKWKQGGIDFNVQDSDVEPVTKKSAQEKSFASSFIHVLAQLIEAREAQYGVV